MFTPGQFVVCVDTGIRVGSTSDFGMPLVKGKVYTVADLRLKPFGDGGVYLVLKEIPPPTGHPFWAFHPDRFRPISDSHEKAIAAMKEPVRAPEMA